MGTCYIAKFIYRAYSNLETTTLQPKNIFGPKNYFWRRYEGIHEKIAKQGENLSFPTLYSIRVIIPFSILKINYKKTGNTTPDSGFSMPAVVFQFYKGMKTPSDENISIAGKNYLRMFLILLYYSVSQKKGSNTFFKGQILIKF